MLFVEFDNEDMRTLFWNWSYKLEPEKNMRCHLAPNLKPSSSLSWEH